MEFNKQSAKLTKDIVDGLKSEHGSDLLVLQKGGFQAVLRPMTKAEFEKFIADASKSNQQGTPIINIVNNSVRACLLYPTIEEFNTALDRTPGIGTAFNGKLMERAGADGEAEEINFL